MGESGMRRWEPVAEGGRDAQRDPAELPGFRGGFREDAGGLPAVSVSRSQIVVVRKYSETVIRAATASRELLPDGANDGTSHKAGFRPASACTSVAWAFSVK